MPIRWFVTSLVAAIPFTVQAQLLEVTRGVHYEEITPAAPVTVTEQDRVEVTEVFWYGCPKCAELAPMMRYWEERMRGDLTFDRIPAVWNEMMATHARIFYTAQELGVAQRVHAAAFEAIRDGHNALRTEEQIAEFFRSQGVEADAFEEAWNAEAVRAGVEHARERTGQYQLERLPGLVVHGMYRVTRNSSLTTHDDMVVAVNLLIRQIRDLRRPD